MILHAVWLLWDTWRSREAANLPIKETSTACGNLNVFYGQRDLIDKMALCTAF